MLAIPPALLDELELSADTEVGLAAQAGRLVVEPRTRPRYSLEQLLSEAKTMRWRADNRTWNAGKATGRELI